MLRFALAVCLMSLALAYLAGCPRKPEPTPEQRADQPAEGRPPAVAPGREDAAGPQVDWTPPLPHAVPPVNSTPVPLPDELVGEYQGAELSADRSVMRVTHEGKTYWLQGFSLPGDNHEAAQNYFTDALRRDGLSPSAEVSVQTDDRQGFFEGLWSSADGRYTVRIYNPEDSGEAGGRTLIMAITDSAPEPAPADGADVGEAQSFER